MNYFEDKQRRINQFVAEANLILGENPLCYTGNFITGQPTHPDMLFVSINPGHSNREDWGDIEARRAQAVVKEFEITECKYIDDVKRGSRYANRIVVAVILIVLRTVLRLALCPILPRPKRKCFKHSYWRYPLRCKQSIKP